MRDTGQPRLHLLVLTSLSPKSLKKITAHQNKSSLVLILRLRYLSQLFTVKFSACHFQQGGSCLVTIKNTDLLFLILLTNSNR